MSPGMSPHRMPRRMTDILMGNVGVCSVLVSLTFAVCLIFAAGRHSVAQLPNSEGVLPLYCRAGTMQAFISSTHPGEDAAEDMWVYVCARAFLVYSISLSQKQIEKEREKAREREQE